MDTLTPQERSERMSKIRDKGSKAEIFVRKLVHGMGYRYKLHDNSLPGKPDLVFPARRKVIFVHGCFWHRHDCFNGQRKPKSRLDFWLPKLEKNRQRDAIVQTQLKEQHWDLLVIWECMIRDEASLRGIIHDFLGATPSDKQRRNHEGS